MKKSFKNLLLIMAILLGLFTGCENKELAMLNNYRTAYNILEKQKEVIEKKLNLVKNNIISLRESHSKEIAFIKTNLMKVQTMFDKSVTDNKVLRKNVDEYKKKYDDVFNEKQSLEEIVNNLKLENEKLKAKFTKKSQNISSMF